MESGLPRKSKPTPDPIFALPAESLLRIGSVMAMTGLGRSTIYRLIQQGKFPRPCHPLGHCRVAAWRAGEILDWLAAVKVAA
jgi:prophage regulatory protein